MNDEQWMKELQELLGDEPAENMPDVDALLAEELPEMTEEPKEAPVPEGKAEEPKKKEKKPAKEKKPMTRQKKIALGVLGGAAAVAVAVLAWTLMSFHIVDFKLYAKNAEELDLREAEVSISHYNKIAQKLPETEIRWNIPFQGGTLADDTTEVTVTTLTAEDVEVLTYLEALETVSAPECTDYDQLKALQQRLPEVEVSYNVRFSGNVYDCNAEEITLNSVAEQDSHLLQYLPNLKTVLIAGGVDQTYLDSLQGMTANLGAQFGILMGEQTVLATDETVTATAITDAELELLSRLHGMKKLHLINPAASADKVLALKETYPEVQVSWEVSFGGKSFSSEDAITEVDLSDTVITDLAEVEAGMAYLPSVETLIFGLCGNDDPNWGNSKSKLAASPIENEDMSAYRDRVRDQYKVVWTVRLGPSIALRTDKDNFMPNHFGVGILPDSYAYNLKYCEDMVCLDLGHMTLTDIFFVEYMPKLKYLILAWTEVQYIEPIRSCKNLVFLELDNSCIRDISPLVDCTALEDVNIGNTWPDVTPLTQMPWLKNVYMIFGSQAGAWKVSQALPDTHVVASGNATVGGNWRKLQNYYDMRDCLGMYYMN